MEISLLNQIEKDYWWFKARREIISDIFWKKYKYSKDSCILSVGVSSGAELEYLSQFCNVTGIDIDEKAVLFCQNKGFHVKQMDIGTCNFSDESFDIIFAMDVLEHIPNDEKAYHQIFRLLKPSGRVVITVPACQMLWSKFDEQGSFPHQRRYNKSILLRLLQKRDLDILKISYFNFFLFPVVFISRKLNVNPSLQLKVPKGVINNILKSIFSFEKYLLRWVNLPIGGSLLAIGQKH